MAESPGVLDLTKIRTDCKRLGESVHKSFEDTATLIAPFWESLRDSDCDVTIECSDGTEIYSAVVKKLLPSTSPGRSRLNKPTWESFLGLTLYAPRENQQDPSAGKTVAVLLGVTGTPDQIKAGYHRVNKRKSLTLEASAHDIATNIRCLELAPALRDQESRTKRLEELRAEHAKQLARARALVIDEVGPHAMHNSTHSPCTSTHACTMNPYTCCL